VAIWERDKIIITIAGSTWLMNLAACIYCTGFFFGFLRCTAINHTSGVATSHTIWIAPLRVCGISGVLKAKFSIISIISTEVVLLALMLIGLLRLRSRGEGGLWQLLFTQVNLSRLHVLR